MSADGFDVVVVGAGSAGGTVASRLSEDEACRVLLLEAGPDFPDEATRPPAFYTGGALSGERGAGSGPPVPDLDWGYRSEELPGGRRVPLPRGRLVGGTSMVNGCVAVRGRPEDFERWVDAGASGWSWSEVLPYYEAAERELTVKTYPRELWLPVQELFVRACCELGFRYCDDLNAPDAWDEICGPWPRNRRNEIRMGSLPTYIRRARGRPNFAIRDRVLVDRVVVAGGRATGVEYVDRDGVRREFAADRVVLSAGAYGSAPILLRSGIGPPDELRALGVDVVADLPVGRGLMEHPGVPFVISLDREHARMGWPGLAAVSRGRTYWGIPLTADEEQGLAVLAFFLGLVDGPAGSIRLATTAPDAAPVIEHGYASLLESDAYANVWEDFQRLLETDVYRAAGARDVEAGRPLRERLHDRLSTGTHPAGGCAIGRVVDPELQVYGVQSLTVADASVFPRHVTNNPNLTCHMVGELASAKLQGRALAAAVAEAGVA